MKAVLFLLWAFLAPARANPPLGEQLGALSPQLGHPDFPEREQALARIRTIINDGVKKEAALEALRDLWRAEKDPEIRARLFHLASELFVQEKGSLFGFRFLVHRILEIDEESTYTIAIEDVIAGSPAMRAGLTKGDLVLGVNGRLLGSKVSLNDILVLFRRLSPEKEHKLRVLRGAEDLTIAIRPDPQELTAADKKILQEGFKKWLLAKESPKKDDEKKDPNP